MAEYKPYFLSLDAALKPIFKNCQKACLMMHQFPSTWVLMHCIKVQGITVINIILIF